MSDNNKSGFSIEVAAAAMQADEKGVTIPPNEYTTVTGPIDLKNGLIKLTGTKNHTFKEIDGKIYRIDENGVQYPPISKQEFEKIQKIHEEIQEIPSYQRESDRILKSRSNKNAGKGRGE